MGTATTRADTTVIPNLARKMVVILACHSGTRFKGEPCTAVGGEHNFEGSEGGMEGEGGRGREREGEGGRGREREGEWVGGRNYVSHLLSYTSPISGSFWTITLACDIIEQALSVGGHTHEQLSVSKICRNGHETTTQHLHSPSRKGGRSVALLDDQ